MKIHAGSSNKVKVNAVKELLEDYPHLAHAKIESVQTPSGVSDQPKSPTNQSRDFHNSDL